MRGCSRGDPWEAALEVFSGFSVETSHEAALHLVST